MLSVKDLEWSNSSTAHQSSRDEIKHRDVPPSGTMTIPLKLNSDEVRAILGIKDKDYDRRWVQFMVGATASQGHIQAGATVRQNRGQQGPAQGRVGAKPNSSDD